MKPTKLMSSNSSVMGSSCGRPQASSAPPELYRSPSPCRKVSTTRWFIGCWRMALRGNADDEAHIGEPPSALLPP